MEPIKKFLKKHGCTVFPLEQKDAFIFVCEGFWGIIAWKSKKNATCSIDKKTILKYDLMSWARVVYPANWPKVQKELEEMLK